MILSAIVKKLRDYSANSFAVSAEPNQPAPYIVASVDSALRELHYGNGAEYQNGMVDTDMEVQIYGSTQTQAFKLANTVRTGLEHFIGVLTSLESPVQNYTIRGIEVTSELTEYDVQRELYYYSLFITVTTGG